MTDLELGWIIGLLEGEGSFMAKTIKRDGRLRGLIQCHMTDRDVIEQLHSLLGGSMNASAYHKEGRKPIWTWFLTRQEDIIRVLPQMIPHLSKRRQKQAMACLAAANACRKIARPLSDAAIIGLGRRWLAGGTLKELAAEVEYHPAALQKRLHAAGFSKRRIQRS